MTAGELIAVIIIFTLAGVLLVIGIVHFLYSQRSVHRCCITRPLRFSPLRLSRGSKIFNG